MAEQSEVKSEKRSFAKNISNFDFQFLALWDNINLKEILKTVCCNDLLENCLIQAESELKVAPKFLCEEFENQFITGLIACDKLSNEISYKMEGIYKTKARGAKHKKWGKKAKITEEEPKSLPPTINASTVWGRQPIYQTKDGSWKDRFFKRWEWWVLKIRKVGFKDGKDGFLIWER